jgi:hypothetical protein
MTDPTPAEIEDFTAHKLLIAHQRLDIGSCMCGWGVNTGDLGRSHSLHVWRELQRAVLPDHDARLRAQVGEGIARALLAHDQRYPRDWIGGSDGATRAAAIARAHTTGGDHERDD